VKYAIIGILFVVLGAGGAIVYLKTSRSSSSSTGSQAGPGHATGANPATSGSELLHGNDQNIAALPACEKHRIPKTICAFCDPSLVESLGFCHGHDVPEAFCTRCSPVLISAFKIEGDWCAEHGLPESQCAACKGESPSKNAAGQTAG
jgi:hypothetical protein